MIRDIVAYTQSGNLMLREDDGRNTRFVIGHTYHNMVYLIGSTRGSVFKYATQGCTRHHDDRRYGRKDGFDTDGKMSKPWMIRT